LLDVLDDHARLQLLEAIRIYQLETKGNYSALKYKVDFSSMRPVFARV
jgi:hypothetical protein